MTTLLDLEAKLKRTASNVHASTEVIFSLIGNSEILEITMPYREKFGKAGTYLRITSPREHNFTVEEVSVHMSTKPKTGWYNRLATTNNFTAEGVKKRLEAVLGGRT